MSGVGVGVPIPPVEHPLGAREVVDLQVRLERGGILGHEGLLEEGQIAWRMISEDVRTKDSKLVVLRTVEL